MDAPRPAIRSVRKNARTTSSTDKQEKRNAAANGLPMTQRSVVISLTGKLCLDAQKHVPQSVRLERIYKWFK
jgi:hypothetical protein